MNKKRQEIDFSNMPLSSSLGHLAYGDLAFTAWRKLKKEHNLDGENEKE
ncbi:MAG: hypothetical protein KJO05_11760 [Bacteroidia bacterium]|nr:hypothetical protein [Bacteroidia bacterium]NNF31619.1 hypothetical protein [Flavobacteriaceae bacterium]MBT8275277.1 hypothetical protein [Bacteroidia bacterium]NNJ83255.1 hypothetical protein [Flavobacteriaceae bacterium]NNK53309.1 hypothetical protein [Flavobacteriaceae bacterium]